MRIAICDDELIASGSKPDILFLDIQMPGMDGMETAKVLRQDNEDMILIFVTAAEEYVFRLMDEATASLDVDNESVIQESISRLIRSLRVKNGSTDK